MYIPAVLERWQDTYYSRSYLHDHFWFVGTPTNQEKKVLAESYTEHHPLMALTTAAMLASLGAVSIIAGYAVWLIIVLFVLSVLGGLAVLYGCDKYRRYRRTELLDSSALFLSGHYSNGNRDCRIEALIAKKPSHISWSELGGDTVFKGEIDSFLGDSVVLNARAHLIRGKVDIAEAQQLNEALRMAAGATFDRISKYEEDRNGCAMSVGEVVKNLKSQVNPELTA